MLKAKHFFALVAVAAALVVAAAYSLKERGPALRTGELVYPELLNKISDVVEVQVMSAGKGFTLKHGGGGVWVAPERMNYVLDANKVHQLLVGAAGLTRIEPKTSNPELYAQLGVEAPSDEKAASVGYTLRNEGGDVLADLIVGESRPGKGDPSASEYYIRENGVAESWLVQGTLPSGVDALPQWLNRTIANIAGDRIRLVTLTHPDGVQVTVRRSRPDASDFELDDLPEGKQVKDVWRLNDMGRVLVDLELEDVKAATSAVASFDERTRRVEMQTFDGLVVHMDVVSESEQQHLVRLQASFDAQQAAAGAKLEGVKLRPAEEVRQEAQTLNERWKSWVYEIPRYKSDYVNRRMADFLPEETTDQAKPQS